MCFPLFHKWHATRVEHYRDTSYCYTCRGCGGMKSFKAVYHCEKCGMNKTKSYFGGGWPELDELNGYEIVNALQSPNPTNKE